MRTTIIYLVIIILTAMANPIMVQGDSSLPKGFAAVNPSFGIRDIKVQKNGKILLCGLMQVAVTPRDKSIQAIIARLNADGTPDKTFGQSGIVNTKETGFLITSANIALQEDGKVIFTGTTYPMSDPVEGEKYRKNTGKPNRDVLVIRYDTNGQLDKTFNGSGWVKTDIDGRWNDAHGLTIQKDGKIIVVGSYLAPRKAFDFTLFRYNQNGTLDEGFGDGGKVVHYRIKGFFSDHVARSVAVQEDGKIVVVGDADGLGDMDQNMALVRYKSNGSTDWTFGFLGKVITKRFGTSENYSVALQGDGKIIIGVGSKMVRFNHNGFPDETFGKDGQALYYNCDSKKGCSDSRGNVALNGDGKIIFSWSAFYKKGDTEYEFATTLGRTNNDGTLDTSFGHNGLTRISGMLGQVIAVLPKGKIIVAGSIRFESDNTTKALSYRGTGLIRLNTDGMIDETFGAGLPVVEPEKAAIDKTEVTKREAAAASSREADTPDPALGRGDNRTVLLGTYSWDVESNKQGNISTSDFWWSQGSDTQRDLIPVSGTTWKVITDRNYDEIDKAFIRAQKLDKVRLSGSDNEYAVLVPGVVIVFRTGEGNFGKMQIERYRSLHDFSFPEAVYLDDSWREMVLKEPNREKYHLQVKWHLFR